MDAQAAYKELRERYQHGQAGHIRDDQLETLLHNHRMDPTMTRGFTVFFATMDGYIQELSCYRKDAVTDDKCYNWYRNSVGRHDGFKYTISNYDGSARQLKKGLLQWAALNKTSLPEEM